MVGVRQFEYAETLRYGDLNPQWGMLALQKCN